MRSHILVLEGELELLSPVLIGGGVNDTTDADVLLNGDGNWRENVRTLGVIRPAMMAISDPYPTICDESHKRRQHDALEFPSNYVRRNHECFGTPGSTLFLPQTNIDFRRS